MRQLLAGQRFGIRVAAGSQNGDEQFCAADHARRAVDDRNRGAGKVDEELLAGAVLLAHHDIEMGSEGRVALGEPGIAIAIGAAFPVFGPEQLERDVGPVHLAMDHLPVGHRSSARKRGRSSSTEEALLELAVVGLGRQRPGETGLARPIEVVADGCSGQPRRGCDGPCAQVLRMTEPQHVSDLAHGSTGTGHRLFSSTASLVEARVADAMSLTRPSGAASPRWAKTCV